MATFLDVTGLQYFSSVFVFIFVFIVIYAVMLWTKVLGENKLISLIAGLLMAVFVILSPLATDVIASTAPFIAVLLLFAVLLNAASKMLGGDFEALNSVKAIFLIFVVLIVIIGAGVKIREKANVETTPTDLSNTMNLLFHPKFLGTVLILAVAVFTVALLASKST